MNDDVKELVRRQFSDKANAYATSAVHAHRPSLERLVALLQPDPAWQALDIATGAGHTAHILAPHVRRVVVTDLTAGMLPTALALATEKGLDNVFAATADAEALPFSRQSFDLATSRLAPHHFPHVDRFLAEAARVLRPGGRLVIVDNVVPGSRRRDKKARRQREAGRYVNAFERLRDPSHVRCLPSWEWRDALYQAGFALQHEETTRKEIDFSDYVARMKVAPDDVVRLRALLLQAPEEVLTFLTPAYRGDRIDFYLSEALFIAQLSPSAQPKSL